MPRLTKTDIEQSLLAGKTVSWADANGKSASIILDTPKQRRLFSFLLTTKIREVKNLPDKFVDDLSAAHEAAGDPADSDTSASAQFGGGELWKIHSLQIEGFGGVNAWKGAPLSFALDGESILIEGPNGSGKSSLTAAIVWALSGERPRDHDDGKPHEARPVYGKDDKSIGDWPPLATYPKDPSDLRLPPPLVRVEITFSDQHGTLALWKRTFDGVETKIIADSKLGFPSILLEAGLMMPARLPQLRFDQGRGRLTEAVEKLTGLDDLIELGAFVQALCHKSRDYLSYKTTELATAQRDFDNQIESARKALVPVSVSVPNFKPADTDDAAGVMATFGKTLSEKASELTKVIAGDLAEGLDLTNAQIQKNLGIALTGAEQDIALGLGGLTTWKTLVTIATALDEKALQKIQETVASSEKVLNTALGFNEQEKADNRYRLKAAAARWHANHGDTDNILACPLCATSLEENPSLRLELDDLKSAGEAATRRLEDNLNSILIELEAAVPQSVRRYLSDDLTNTPRASLLIELQETFVNSYSYANYLTKCGAIIETARQKSPVGELVGPEQRDTPSSETSAVLNRMAKMEQMCAIVNWFHDQKPAWEQWWKELTTYEFLPDGSLPEREPEPVSLHLARLSKALKEAEPYRTGAEAMRTAWSKGKTAYVIEKEQTKRKAITENLSPLKNLANLAEAQARTAINELSDRIARIHSETYLSDTLQFQKATLEKRAGLIVRGQFGENVRIDATLVANTSWLRGVLWAFIFALREEAVEQLGSDPFPILVLDDPQQTFDTEHRHRWAEQVAKLQKTFPGVQLILATHDETFLSFLGVDGIAGRRTLICSAGPELGHVGLFEGDALDRQWEEVQKLKTPAAALGYMAAVRVYLEGMLHLMLRGEDVNVSTFVVGDCREKISVLNKAGHEPWSRPLFASLAGLLGKGVSQVAYIENAHHTSGHNLGMTEAVDVQKYWQKPLRPTVERAFRMIRDHRALHGGLTALHAMTLAVMLPEGHKAVIRTLQLPIVGAAAALSGGRVADGCVHLTMDGTAKEIVELKDHVVFRIVTPTLEPVARPGDFLLVSEHAVLSPKSLIVALNEDRLLARRLEIAENHTDVAVLTANSINPRMIAAPVVAKMATLSLRKIVGVIFDYGKWAGGQHGDMELCDCGGEAYVKAAFSGMQGLVEVSGHSAEPHALDKQFLIIGKPIALSLARSRLEGRPVIAEDSSGSRYFKRYRGADSIVILESLEIGGDFAPIVLAEKAGAIPHIVEIWPVLGVLFEKPK